MELGVDSVDRPEILKAAKLHLLQIPCKDEIKAKDVMRVIKENRSVLKRNGIDMLLLQIAAALVSKEGRGVMNNAIVEVVGELIHVSFHTHHHQKRHQNRNVFKVYLISGEPTLHCSKRLGHDDVTMINQYGNIRKV
ncbi:uncharacterized protein LOC144447930 [Glandiceps talaboti]